MPLSTADVRALLDEAQEPTFYILDISRLKLSLNDVIVGANTGARGETPLWHHPMIKELVTVSADGLVQLAAKGLSSLTFGNLHIRVFGTLDEAVEYCRVNAVAG